MSLPSNVKSLNLGSMVLSTPELNPSGKSWKFGTSTTRIATEDGHVLVVQTTVYETIPSAERASTISAWKSEHPEFELKAA